MNTTLDISVVIPTFNAGKFIEECLNSVITQSLSPLEVIVVDNNSTDNTVKIARKYKDIKIIFERQQGAPFARNTGIKSAKGEWIQFLDADDILLPEKLNKQLDLIKENKDVGLLMSSYLFRDIDGSEEIVRVRKDPFISLLDNKGYGQTSANLWKKSDLLKVGGFNENQRVYNDPELILRLIKAGVKVLFDDQVNSVYRNINKNSLTKNLDSNDLLDGYDLSRRVYQYVIENYNPCGRYLTQISNLLLKRIRMLAEVDIEKAISAFHNHPGIINNLNSRKSDFGPDRFYLMLLKTFGFKTAEFATRVKRKLLQ
jgi:glycosyltransferase involved in cell wall biosynthesis